MATVLVVDDRAENRELLVTLLAYKGHRSIEAADGAEALALVRSERPELVISDILMPTMDGYEFVRQLRSDQAIAQTEVIFYTAHYHEREARNLARACGVYRVLTKPSEPEEILRAIDLALAHLPQAPTEPIDREFDREHLRLMTEKLSAKIDELHAANMRLTALATVSLELASERDPRTLLDHVCRDSRDLVSARYAILCVRDKGGAGSLHFASSGFDAATAARLPRPALNAGIFAEVLEKRAARRSSGGGKDLQEPGLPAGYPAVRSLLAAPIVSLDSTYGWICLLNKVGLDEFGDDDEKLLTSIAAQVGRIYETGSLYAEIKRTADQLQAELAERKNMSEKLLESERRFSTMLSNVELISLMLDLRGRITYCNDYLLRLTGWSRDELMDRDWFELFIPPDQIGTRITFEDLLSDLPSAWHHTNEILTRRGERRLVQWNNTLLRSPSGDVVGTASIGEDVTERSRAEDEIRRLNANLESRVAERTAELAAANKELEAFDYSISHDLRGPLGRMLGFAGALLEDYGAALDARGREYVERIQNAGQRMDQLVEDLLRLSTVTRTEVRRADVDVSALVRTVFDALRKARPGHDAQLVLAPGLRAYADPGLLRIVLENLVGNAWKFTARRSGARIELFNRREGGETIFVVRDNGAGFEEAKAQKLFTPFRRLHDSSEFEGTGIGLATVQRIINRHGGRIRASGAVNEGAAFEFTLAPKSGAT